ncbi:hypothetical protein GRF29_28g222327 [Pseudopithomyces chartarum]|uniref:Uncharacterized protein n=1 Tax=Pseudopithomyces chartarum TaxID=1892770 RepID=A0AAN6M290_9PLEO|nr:hypothetical protein GRF29_28g222327 [Pseudopithomyces chartarum]
MQSVETLRPFYGPGTFPELLRRLRHDEFPRHRDLLDHIETAAMLSAHMRQACEDDSQIDPTELLQFLVKLESIAARGWYNALDELIWKENYCYQYEKSLEQLEQKDIKLQELERTHKQCEADIHSFEQVWRQLESKEAEVFELKKEIDMLEREKSEAERGLGSVVTRMESLPAQLDQRTDPKPATNIVRPDTPGNLSDVDNSITAQSHGSDWKHEDSVTTDEPTEIDESETHSNSSVAAEVGSVPGNNSRSYPPPLPPATEEATRADERKTHMLSEVEDTLWIQESKDREYLAKRHGPPRTTAHLSPSSPQIPSSPAYIYIPLPRNFIIPRVNPTFLSLIFPSPPAVFHFPEYATRDQLLDILRKVHDIVDPEQIEETNIVRVRTHEFEWGLKNAIRKVLGKSRWDLVVGDEWPTEGRGDTYIVSKRDLYFDVPGSQLKPETRSGNDATTSGQSQDHRSEQQIREDELFEEYFETLESQDDEFEDMPHLRGGAPMSFQDSPNNLGLRYGLPPEVSRTLAEHCGITTSMPIQEDVPLTSPQALIEQVRVLHLQNGAYCRRIEAGQELVKDMEETIIWQNGQLVEAHHEIAELKVKMQKQKDETIAAVNLAGLAKEEARILQAILEQIHEQAVRLTGELEEQESRISAQYHELSDSHSPYESAIRGGGDSSSTHTRPSTTNALPSTPPTDAHSFYFFPSISMIVLLTNPLYHCQFPAHTSLPEIHDLLSSPTSSLPPDPHLSQIRTILQARDAAGISLPDTTSGRQIMISAPDLPDDVSTASGEPGHKGWNRSFGPTEYMYERSLKESIESLKTPTTENREMLSPRGSLYEKRFGELGVLVDRVGVVGRRDEEGYFDAVDLIDEIEREAKVSREQSGYRAPFVSEDVGTERVEGGTSSRARVDSLGERRGYKMAMPLPPVVLDPMFPTGSGGTSQGAYMGNQRVRSGNGPGNTGAIHSNRLDGAHIPPSRAPHVPRTVHHPSFNELYRSAQLNYNHYLAEQPDPASLLSSTAPTVNSTQQVTSTNYPSGRNKQGWGTWRHPRGEECEAWIPSSSLNPLRQKCSFCDLPFVQVSQETQTHDEDKTSANV